MTRPLEFRVGRSAVAEKEGTATLCERLVASFSRVCASLTQQLTGMLVRDCETADLLARRN
jgi:hypothetical protein